MTKPWVRSQCGIGMLEFLMLVAVIGVLAVALMDRLVDLEREAERTEIGLTERNMRIGLNLAIGECLMRGREDRIAELLDANPVSFLGRLPRGYVGETSVQGGPGAWRFDSSTHILSYRPRQPEAFDGKTELRWKMESQGALGGRIVGMRVQSLPN